MKEDEKDIVNRVREQVRRDNPSIPLETFDYQSTRYMADQAWPFIRERLKERANEK